MLRLTTLVGVLSFALLAAAPTASAESRHVSLGEIAIMPTGATYMTQALRTTIESEMRDLDLHGAHKDAILSVSLVTLDTEHDRGTVSNATCVISVTLRSRAGGVLFAVLEGRARAQGASGHVGESALRGAVHGALSRVPDALK